MLGVEVATIRAWEERYKVVTAARIRGSQRLGAASRGWGTPLLGYHVSLASTSSDARTVLAASSPDLSSSVMFLLKLPETFGAPRLTSTGGSRPSTPASPAPPLSRFAVPHGGDGVTVDPW